MDILYMVGKYTKTRSSIIFLFVRYLVFLFTESIILLDYEAGNIQFGGIKFCRTEYHR